jgi:Uma2 family endonuclease
VIYGANFMATKIRATIEDLYRVEGKAELVDGQIVCDSPTGGLPGYAAAEIFASLRAYAKRTGNGYAIADNVGFLVDLPHRQSFSPDAAFYIGELTMKFIDGAPVFAVEVRSESDYGPLAERKMAQKRADYFAAETRVVWDVDIKSDERVRVYRSSDPNTSTIYHPGEIAEAEPAVPGWSMPIDDLLP